MLVVDPIPLYKDGEWRRVPAIDSQAWINAGWSISEVAVVEQSTENPPENSFLNNDPTPTTARIKTINLQHEPTEAYVEQSNTELTPTETKVSQRVAGIPPVVATGVETTKRKSPNQ